MKNTVEEGKLNILIYGNEGRYIGICKEFGFVEEGKTYEEVERKLNSGIDLLLRTVAENPRLAPSLNTAPPLKYLFTFYALTLFSTVAAMYFDCLQFTSRPRLGYV